MDFEAPPSNFRFYLRNLRLDPRELLIFLSVDSISVHARVNPYPLNSLGALILVQ